MSIFSTTPSRRCNLRTTSHSESYLVFSIFT